MIIDIHTHTFPEEIAPRAISKLQQVSHIKAFSDGTNNGLLKTAGEAGIDLSIVLPVATSAKQVEHINISAAKTNEAYVGRGIFSFGCIHPDYEDYRAELSRVREYGLKGIKLHPVYQESPIDGTKFLRILDRAAELGLIVIIHAGYDIGFPGIDQCGPRKIRHAIDVVGDFDFILAHMGSWRQWDDVLRYLPDTGVYLDTSFSVGSIHPVADDGFWAAEDLPMMDERLFMELYAAFGADRLIFGTDSPWAPQKDEVEFIKSLPIDESCKNKILGENAIKLLRL